MELLTVSKGHQCPLCPGHQDEEEYFGWSDLVGAQICVGCEHEIHNGLIFWKERPTEKEYNHAETIERLEQLTGQSFQQLKFRHMKDEITAWNGSTPDYLQGIAFQEMSESELRVLNDRLDYEYEKLQMAEKLEKFKTTWG